MRLNTYLDECGFSEFMIRTDGYALRGNRCVCPSDHSNKKRTNVIGALVGKELIALQAFQTTIQSEQVKLFLKKLIPLFEKKTLFVMDNASFHKKKEILDLFSLPQHQLLFLPTYSPDLNPIEHYWAKIKHRRRKTACSIPDLLNTIQCHYF